MTADIDCMLRNNINAVRTCHYPDQIPWYYLCDKAGIYVMAETNLESHGTFQKLGAISTVTAQCTGFLYHSGERWYLTGQ